MVGGVGGFQRYHTAPPQHTTERTIHPSEFICTRNRHYTWICITSDIVACEANVSRVSTFRQNSSITRWTAARLPLALSPGARTAGNERTGTATTFRSELTGGEEV